MKFSRQRLGFLVVASRFLRNTFAAPVAVQDSAYGNSLGTKSGSCEESSCAGNVVSTLFLNISPLTVCLYKTRKKDSPGLELHDGDWRTIVAETFERRARITLLSSMS
jgi:hypothetical protein